jgi:hypothetical protein
MQVLRNMWSRFTPTRRTAVLLFLGLSGLYLSLSPGSIAGQGYVDEEMQSGLRMLAVVNAWLKGRPIPPMLWSRHGPVPVLFDLPFLKLGKVFVSPDFMLSFQPVLLTAGLLTILYLWLRKLCSPGMGLLLTLTGAFGTMLWPYAYISLETKQSFLVLLAGYLALADGKLRGWPRLLLFAATCGLAMTMKSTGITLWPAIAYLVYVQFRGDWRLRRAQVLAVVLVIGGVWALGAWGRNFYWGPRGGGTNSLRFWLADSALQVFTNAIGVFGSPTKGLFVYAPILLASIYAVSRAFRAHREIVIYALLVTACSLGLISILRSPADELWGCRYMHAAIAPLILCIGAAWPRFHWRREGGPLLALALLGLVISFLGAFYYYAMLDFAMKDAGQNTLEWITGDNVWNHIEFNARLFGIWFHGGTAPVMWTPAHIWIWTPPADAQPWKSIDLRQFCQPQSFMLRFWHVPKNGTVLVIFLLYVGSLAVGLLLLAWVGLRTVKHQPVADAGDLAFAAHEARSS